MTRGQAYNRNRSEMPKNGDIMTAEMTLIDYILVWMEVFKVNTVRASTYDRLMTSYYALKAYAIAYMPIGDITFMDIQRYLNELVESGYALSSIKKQLRIVTSPLKRAASMKIIGCDPSVGVKLPLREAVKKEIKEVSAYNADELALLNTIFDETEDVGYLCCAFMIETGLRAGEALALKWSCVDLKTRKVSVEATVVNLANKKQSYVQNAPKSRSSARTIPLTDKAVTILCRLKEICKYEWVFGCEKTHLSYEQLRYRTQKLCKAAGVEYRGEHIFRHSFATNCYYKGIDVKILSKLLGHADVNTTYNTYIHLYGDGFQDMYKALVG